MRQAREDQEDDQTRANLATLYLSRKNREYPVHLRVHVRIHPPAPFVGREPIQRPADALPERYGRLEPRDERFDFAVIEHHAPGLVP